MTALPKKSVYNEDDLLRYLGDKASAVDRLYHFTTYDSLLAVLAGKSFRLTRTSLLNDKKEREFSGSSDCFVMSMTSDKEYISMWSMYGRASGIKIRIDFSRKLFSHCFVEDNIYSDADLKIKYFAPASTGGKILNGCSLKDIVYIDKSLTEYRHREKPFVGLKASETGIKKLGGFIKFDAWEFEREIRARVLDIGTPDIDYVFVSLTDDLVKDIRVTFNPWISTKMKSEITKSLSSMGVSSQDSDFDGQMDEI